MRRGYPAQPLNRSLPTPPSFPCPTPAAHCSAPRSPCTRRTARRLRKPMQSSTRSAPISRSAFCADSAVLRTTQSWCTTHRSRTARRALRSALHTTSRSQARRLLDVRWRSGRLRSESPAALEKCRRNGGSRRRRARFHGDRVHRRRASHRITVRGTTAARDRQPWRPQFGRSEWKG